MGLSNFGFLFLETYLTPCKRSVCCLIQLISLKDNLITLVKDD